MSTVNRMLEEIIIIIIILSTFKLDIVLSNNAGLPYGHPMNTDTVFLQYRRK